MSKEQKRQAHELRQIESQQRKRQREEEQKKIRADMQLLGDAKRQRKILERVEHAIIIQDLPPLNDDELSIWNEEFEKHLYGSEWLSDKIINEYMKLIQHRSSGQNIFVAKTYFYDKLRESGYNGLANSGNMKIGRRENCLRINLLNYDSVVMPMYLGKDYRHWALMVFRPKQMVVEYYDSYFNGKDPFNNAKSLLLGEHTTHGAVYNQQDWTFNIMPAPIQQNTNDCGVFTLMFAERLCRGASIQFKVSIVADFRLRIAEEIKKQKLFDI